MMRVAVLGTGALGCVFAARLAASAEVWVLGTWGDAVAAIGTRGVRIHENDGAIHDVRVAGAAFAPTAVPPCDLALLLVKSYQTERAAAWAADLLKEDGLAVSLQNGLDNEEKLAHAVGDARSAAGVNYVGRDQSRPRRGPVHRVVDQLCRRQGGKSRPDRGDCETALRCRLMHRRRAGYRGAYVGEGDHQRSDQSADRLVARAEWRTVRHGRAACACGPSGARSARRCYREGLETVVR